MMKKMFRLILSSLVLLSLAACGNGGQGSQSAAAEQNEKGKQDVASGVSAKKGKTLVVYYSASGTTKGIAGYIAEATKGDIFEVKPAALYSDADLNYRDVNSRVCKEHNDKNRSVKLVSTTVPKWQEYDTVFIGYPIWWGIAAWPVDGFIKANDFTGKKVITFATAISSGFGESGKLLAKMSKNGTWMEGKCFHGGSRDEVREWVKVLGL